LLFASEVKAMLPCLEAAPALCPKALGQIFTFWAPLGSRTAFDGVAEVPPGGVIVIRGGEVRERIWWRWSYPDAAAHETAPGPDPAAKAEEAAALLDDAVRLRLRSDVPVGAYLSGGLDSSTLAAIARSITGTRLQTFSIRFASPEFDEGAHQRRMAEHLDVAHAEIVATPRGIADAFPEVIRHAESPILRSSPAPMYLLSGLVRRAGFKVVLTGEGADEAFGGYDLFKEAKIRRFWARQPASRLRPLLLRRLYPWLGGAGAQPIGHLTAFYGAGLGDPDRFDFSHLPRWRTTSQIRMFLAPEFAAAGEADSNMDELEASLPSGFARWHPFHRAQYLEATILLPKFLLNSQGDRMLMAHSVEGRFPFLDHRVIEFANRLHPRLKMRGLDEKHLLKRAAARLIPREVLERPKQPYRAPDHAAFFAAGSPDYVDEMLSEAALRRTGVFDPARVGLLVRKLRGAQTANMRDQMALTGILSTQLWCYLFKQM
jgi:asparagine synthase (glutamine-hydrolysing)